MMEQASDQVKNFLARMAMVERDLTHPVVEPRDAATLILIDRSGPEPKVLLGRRHRDSKFMPGKFVFPGGRKRRAGCGRSSPRRASTRISASSISSRARSRRRAATAASTAASSPPTPPRLRIASKA
jgi:hypothetical protein